MKGRLLDSNKDLFKRYHPLLWMDSVIFPYFWNVENLNISGGDMEISGWALPIDGHSKLTEFWLNDKPVKASYPYLRKDVGDIHCYWPDARKSGFYITLTDYKHMIEDAKTDITLNIRRHNSLFNRQQLSFYLNPEHTFPSGSLNSTIYSSAKLSCGPESIRSYSRFRHLMNIITNFNASLLPKSESILNLDCGKHSILCHLQAIRKPGLRVYGADIDKDKVDRCAAELKGAHLCVFDGRDKLPFGDNQFDIVIDCLTMVKFSSEVSLEILSELKRVTKPGGLLLLAVNSDSALVYNAKFMDQYKVAEFRKKGICDFTECLEGPGDETSRLVISHNSINMRYIYYTSQYIYSNFSKLFEVLKIVRNINGGLIDLAVLKKR